jgi:hypothetical protein
LIKNPDKIYVEAHCDGCIQDSSEGSYRRKGLESSNAKAFVNSSVEFDDMIPLSYAFPDPCTLSNNNL